MNRPKDIETRTRLLALATEYVVCNGVSQLSLRPMAEAMGTSARMLLHHFGSKDALIQAVLSELEQSFISRAEQSFASNKSVSETIMELWQLTSSLDMEQALRAMFEVWGEGLIFPDHYESYLNSMVSPWVVLLQRQIQRQNIEQGDAKILATLIMGNFVGLQLVRLTEGDDQTTTQAIKKMLSYIIQDLK